jgi:hypothetical protein
VSGQASGRWPTLDALARELNFAISFADEAESMLEDRIIALEEITAARWPRRIIVRRRLARKLRASGRAHAYAGRSFRARRIEAAGDDLILRGRS